MKRRWKQYLLYASLIVIAGGLVSILVETVRAKNTGFETKTLWDWMELLVIPLFLAGGAIYLERSERKAEREIATDRQQETALQNYIDRMDELLLKEKLRTSRNKEVRNIARIRTLTVLRGLDATRKGLVLRFLYEAGLINKEKPIVDLSEANLRGANLGNTDLSGANLEEVNLNGAILRGTCLIRANLIHAELNEADLDGAELDFANLWNADLSDANLNDSYLKDIDAGVSEDGIPIVSEAILGASLFKANLSDAFLNGAKVNDFQLAFPKSLKGAIMPDGTKHE